MTVCTGSRRVVRAAVTIAAICAGMHPASAAAQAAPAFALGAPKVGDCKVEVTIDPPRAGDQIGVVVDQTLLREQPVTAGQKTVAFPLTAPLRPGSLIVVRVNGVEASGTDGAPLRVRLGDDERGKATDTCAETTQSDDESPFVASFFLGEVVDNFAPDKVGNYKSENPDEALKKKAGFIFGFDFDYRLAGRSDSPVQLWIEGETMHGVRTADVNCAVPAEERPPVCDATPANIADRARYILKNASSLEVWAYPRVEFHTLQFGTDSPAKLYAGISLGFVALDDAPQVYRSHHIGLGLAAKTGTFDKSYLEVGWGKNELFSTRWNRLKIDGLLSFSADRLKIWPDMGRIFVEMTIDNSLDGGADSVRTFFGVDIDLRKASQ